MDVDDQYYFILSAGFVFAINLIAFVGLSLSYSKSRKPYLAIACTAVVIEVTRQIPDTLLVQYPDSNSLYILSFSLQFLASLTLLCSLLRSYASLRTRDYGLIALLAIAALTGVSYQSSTGLPQSTLTWYIVSAPAILATLAIVWAVWRLKSRFSAGWFMLSLSTLALFIVRVLIPAIESIELLYLVYYMEVLLFPTAISALGLIEVEMTHDRVRALLDSQTQSRSDLQFIIDNSLDIILTADNVGLLQSWNKRAESLFGYTEEQAKGKLHIDELFSDNYCHQNAEAPTAFEATMENVDGASFPVTIRLKTVFRNSESYSIYVVNSDSAMRPFR